MIALYVRAQFLDGRMPNFTDGLFVYVALSLFYHALWFTISPSIYSYSLSSATVCQKLQWVGLIFIAPAALGLLSAINIRNQWIQRLFQKFGMSVIHPVGSAWDWKFSLTPESWVIVKLKDGTTWGGILGSNSFISSSPQERDIFIEKVYRIEDNDDWVERQSSVLITHDQIQSVEFWPKGA